MPGQYVYIVHLLITLTVANIFLGPFHKTEYRRIIDASAQMVIIQFLIRNSYLLFFSICWNIVCLFRSGIFMCSATSLRPPFFELRVYPLTKRRIL